MPDKLPPLLGLQKASSIGPDKRAEMVREMDANRKEASMPNPEKPGGFSIPLFTHNDYLRKVASESLEDLGEFGRKLLTQRDVVARPISGVDSHDAVQRFTNAVEDPDISMMVHSTMHDPGVAREIFNKTSGVLRPDNPGYHASNPELDSIVQALANAYHNTLNGLK